MAEPKIKKVKPYPFRAELKDAGGTQEVSVVKLTKQGMLFEAPGTKLQPGDKIEVAFTIPVLGGAVAAVGVVIKLYSQLVGATGARGSMSLVEAHFRAISPTAMEHISSFLEQTGQGS
ncbi:MAG: PilZ domain-containing protein [Bdellovibrionales bacterium]|jgi:hypothetical protein|nr:PilZ domain-containing protein [Bdellovibrionales bacterium]